MLPEATPFWSEPEAPLPKAEPISVQEEPCFLIERDADSGHVVSLMQGSGIRVGRFAIVMPSTQSSPARLFRPDGGANHEWLAGCGIDSTIAIQIGKTVRSDGTLWQCRGLTCATQTVTSDFAVSEWASIPQVSVRTWLVPMGAWHVRVHEIKTDVDIQFAEARSRGGSARGRIEERFAVRSRYG